MLAALLGSLDLLTQRCYIYIQTQGYFAPSCSQQEVTSSAVNILQHFRDMWLVHGSYASPCCLVAV